MYRKLCIALFLSMIGFLTGCQTVTEQQDFESYSYQMAPLLDEYDQLRETFQAEMDAYWTNPDNKADYTKDLYTRFYEDDKANFEKMKNVRIHTKALADNHKKLLEARKIYNDYLEFSAFTYLSEGDLSEEDKKKFTEFVNKGKQAKQLYEEWDNTLYEIANKEPEAHYEFEKVTNALMFPY